jgi:hypothetical protein
LRGKTTEPRRAGTRQLFEVFIVAEVIIRGREIVDADLLQWR